MPTKAVEYKPGLKQQIGTAVGSAKQLHIDCYSLLRLHGQSGWIHARSRQKL